MPRPMWTGSITFGLVSVPVKLYTAVSQKEVRFHMLHAKDGGRIHQKRVCSIDEEEVPYEDLAKGYEISRGNYVMIDPDELQALNPKASRAIDIEDFVDLEDIDPIFYEGSYYLVPDRGANRPYALLLATLKKTKKVGIARMVMRTKQYLCALRPMGNAIALNTMLYADEIVPQEDIEGLGEQREPTERELAMAEQLVKSLAGKWNPDKYKDEHREQVLELIKRKAEGEEVVAPPPEPEAPRVVSLMDALKKSLAAAQRSEAPRAEGGLHRRRSLAAKSSRARGKAKGRSKKQGGRTTAHRRKRSA
jgi:DNA end-binding protein Ku